MKNEMSLREAASQLGINLEALRQRVRRRGLKLGARQGPKGLYRVVTADDLEKLQESPSTLNVQSTVEDEGAEGVTEGVWRQDAVLGTYRVNVDSTEGSYVQSTISRPKSADQAGAETRADVDEDEVFEAVVESTDRVNVQSTTRDSLLQTLAEVANKALDKQRELEKELEALRGDLIEAMKLKALAERQALAVHGEIESYKRVLTEQAESLAEERAQRMAAEMAAPVVPTEPSRGEWGRRVRRWFFGQGAQQAG